MKSVPQRLLTLCRSLKEGITPSIENWPDDHEHFSMLEFFNEQLVTAITLKSDLYSATSLLVPGLNSYQFEGITPGTYEPTTETGLQLWSRHLSANELLTTEFQLAAQTEPIDLGESFELSNSVGSLRIHKGIESGTIQLNFEE